MNTYKIEYTLAQKEAEDLTDDIKSVSSRFKTVLAIEAETAEEAEEKGEKFLLLGTEDVMEVEDITHLTKEN